MTPILQFESVSKAFGKQTILSNLDLTVEAQTNLLLTGPSGCGKSTLLRLIAGLEEPDAGAIRIAGTLVSENGRIIVPPHRREVALVFQDLGLWPNLTALDNVLLGMDGLKVARKEKLERATSALASCGIKTLAKTRPGRLSGGEQQRLAFARALAVKPRLLLLDEPFSGLDIVLRQSLLEVLCQLSVQNGVTVLLVGHVLSDAIPLNASIAVLEGGRICEQGTRAELLKDPASQTLQAWRRLEQPKS